MTVATTSVVAESATTPALFNLPEFPESSTHQLQVAPNVGDMTVGQAIEGEYGPAVVLHIEVSKWRFSWKPKHRLTFRDLASGEEYASSYYPDAPIEDNHRRHYDADPGSRAGYSTEQFQMAVA